MFFRFYLLRGLCGGSQVTDVANRRRTDDLYKFRERFISKRFVGFLFSNNFFFFVIFGDQIDAEIVLVSLLFEVFEPWLRLGAQFVNDLVRPANMLVHAV